MALSWHYTVLHGILNKLSIYYSHTITFEEKLSFESLDTCKDKTLSKQMHKLTFKPWSSLCKIILVPLFCHLQSSYIFWHSILPNYLIHFHITHLDCILLLSFQSLRFKGHHRVHQTTLWSQGCLCAYASQFPLWLSPMSHHHVACCAYIAP